MPRALAPQLYAHADTFIAAFPEALLDRDTIAATFTDTPECAPETRVIRLKTLHRALPKNLGLTPSKLAEIYQFAPCLATLQTDRFVSKISASDCLFGEGKFIQRIFNDPERFAPLLQYNEGDFLSIGIYCAGALRKMGISRDELSQMVMHEPKLLGLDPTQLALQMNRLVQEARTQGDDTIIALHDALLTNPSSLLERDKELSFYLTQKQEPEPVAPASTTTAAPEEPVQTLTAAPHQQQGQQQPSDHIQTAPKRALNKIAQPAAPLAKQRKLSASGVIGASLNFAALQGAFSGTPKPITRADLGLPPPRPASLQAPSLKKKR